MLNFCLIERRRILIFIWKDPDADPDPTFHPDAYPDLDPSFQSKAQRPQTLENVLK